MSEFVASAVKDGTLVVLEMPTSRRIPSDSWDRGSEAGSVALDVKFGLLAEGRSKCQVVFDICNAGRVETRIGRARRNNICDACINFMTSSCSI